MKSLSRPGSSLILLTILSSTAQAQRIPVTQPTTALSIPVGATAADRLVIGAEARLKDNPRDADACVALANGFMSKARETGDGAYYSRADAACRRALELKPDHYGALRALAWVYGGQHRFALAADAAKRAMALNSDDPWNYGMLGDALIELGDYPGAETVIQKMVDLKPSAGSMCRVAHFRELTGDPTGAAEMMSKAARIIGRRDPEQYAWCLTQLGNLSFGTGQLDQAAAQYEAALKSFPGYYLATSGMGRVRAAQGRASEGVAYYEQSLAAVPTHDAVVGLGDLLTSLNRTYDATKVLQIVDTIEKINRANGIESDAQVALFYADHDRDLDGALRIATACAKDRQDVRTLDALAWTLYKRGQYEEAGAAMVKALRLGTRDAQFHFHSGMIQLRLGHAHRAVEELRLALEINPYFHATHASEARQAIEEFKDAAVVEVREATK